MKVGAAPHWEFQASNLIEPESFAMVSHERGIGREPIRAEEGLPRSSHELRLKGVVWEIVSQPPAQDQPEIIVEADQPSIKSSIKMGRETEPVFWIQPLLWEFAPRQYVARNQ
jgi:hypothetical protein